MKESLLSDRKGTKALKTVLVMKHSFSIFRCVLPLSHCFIFIIIFFYKLIKPSKCISCEVLGVVVVITFCFLLSENVVLSAQNCQIVTGKVA